jgi:carbon starvation protein CstA
MQSADRVALLAVSVWLARTSRSNFFVKVPMLAMYLISLSALGMQALQNFRKGHYLLAGLSVLLFILAIFLAREARKAIRMGREEEAPALLVAGAKETGQG